MNLAKIVVDSKIYKMELPSGFAEFIQRLSRKISPCPLEVYDLTYRDVEKQTVGITCEEDYQMAVVHAAKPMRFELKSKSEAVSLNENLFRLRHLVEYIVRMEDDLDAASTKIDHVLKNEPELKLSPVFSFTGSLKADLQIGSTGGRVDSDSAAAGQEGLGSPIDNFLNLVVLSNLKTFVVDQFRDVRNHTQSSQTKQNPNVSNSTCHANISEICQPRFLREVHLLPAAEKASAIHSETFLSQKADLKGEVTRSGRVPREQERLAH